jgi:hypothetical protein
MITSQIGHDLTSVPSDAAASPRIIATAEPLLLPPTDCDGMNAPRVCPPLALHPLVAFVERKLAHSDRFVLPNRIAPAFLSRATMAPSLAAFDPSNAYEPEDAFIRSMVKILSLTSMGTPWRGLTKQLDHRNSDGKAYSPTAAM